jgi:inorganic pyrophosphatase
LHPVFVVVRSEETTAVNDFEVEVVVETPRGSRNRYKFDHECWLIRLDNHSFSRRVSPADCGFVVGTLTEDGEPLDAIVLLEESSFPGCHLRTRPVGVFWATGDEGLDPTVVCVLLQEERWRNVTQIADLPWGVTVELGYFFDARPAQATKQPRR